MITPQSHAKIVLHSSFYNRKQNPWNLKPITETLQHRVTVNHVTTLSSRLVENQGGKTFTKFYSCLELCIASISFSTVFLRTGIYEETVSMVFSPYNFTFTVLFCKQIIEKKGKRIKKKNYMFRVT